MEPKASGRCLCGSIFFVATGPLRAVVNCHCHRCRRFTGHHMAATATETPNLEVHDSYSLLRWYQPASDVSYGFCGRCGSSLFWRSDASPDQVSICAGTLDPPTFLWTVEAWWTSEASDYHTRPLLKEFDTE